MFIPAVEPRITLEHEHVHESWAGRATVQEADTLSDTCCRRGSDVKAAAMLDGMQLALMLTMNPDGFAAKRRGNG